MKKIMAIILSLGILMAMLPVVFDAEKNAAIVAGSYIDTASYV